MGHPYGSMEILALDIFFKFRNLALAFPYFQFAVQQAKAGAVVSPVFKPVKAFDKDGISFFRAHICYNSAHNKTIYCPKLKKDPDTVNSEEYS